MYLFFINTRTYLQCSRCHSNKVVGSQRNGETELGCCELRLLLGGGLSSMFDTVFSNKQGCGLTKDVMWSLWAQDVLRLTDTDMSCQAVILSVLLIFATHSFRAQVQEMFLYHRTDTAEMSFSHRQDN